MRHTKHGDRSTYKLSTSNKVPFDSMPERLRKNLRLEDHAAHHGSSAPAKVAVRRAKASADRSNYSETDRARRAVEVSRGIRRHLRVHAAPRLATSATPIVLTRHS